MWEDPIVEKVRRVREEHAAKFHYDLDAIYRDLKDQDERDPRRVVSPAAQTASGGARNLLSPNLPLSI